MLKLKLQFLLFFTFVALLFGFFIDQSFEQIRVEENRLWQGISEKAFNQMQARISDFLSAEDLRPFSDYDTGINGRPTPLSLIPRHDPRGLIGYFQINPDGQFTTPYLVRSHSRVFTLQTKLRIHIHYTLKELTESFRTASADKPDFLFVPPQQTAQTTRKDAKGIVDLESPTAVKPEADEDFSNTVLKKKITQRSSSAPKQVYPNPLMKQQQQKFSDKELEELEEAKEMDPPSAASVPADQDQAPTAFSTGAGFSAQDDAVTNTPAPAPENTSEALNTIGAVIPEVPEAPPVLDPFRARLIDKKYVVFYRKAWLDQKMYIQGFTVLLEEFYNWLMQQSFDDSGLPGFAVARLELPNMPLLSHGTALQGANLAGLLFERQLGYPLNRFIWRVYFRELPKLPTRGMLSVFTAAVAIALAGGLYLLYRTSAAQIILSQKRQDFVSAVTHELKTPLTSIRMSAEMLREGWITEPAKRDEYYGVIARESERLSNLIHNVLQLARLEKKNVKLNLVTQSPNATFASFASELEAFVTQHKFVWLSQAQPDLPPIRFDADVVKQILYNLVDNSIKFSQFTPQKIVRMELAREDNNIVWSISDAGPGIPKNEVKKVFDNFYRVENELTRKTKGTGIGLAMAKMMIENMDARIEARNLSPNGLCIRMIFPVQA